MEEELIRAVKNNDIENVRLLLDEDDTDPNIQNNDGDTALMNSSRNGKQTTAPTHTRLTLPHQESNKNDSL